MGGNVVVNIATILEIGDFRKKINVESKTICTDLKE